MHNCREFEHQSALQVSTVGRFELSEVASLVSDPCRWSWGRCVETCQAIKVYLAHKTAELAPSEQ